MASTDTNNMEYTERLLRILLIEKSLSAEMRINVEARAMAMIGGLTYDAGNFLHRILDADEHTEDEVKTLINALPSALSHIRDYADDEDDDDDDEMLPIQAAACEPGGRKSIPFISLFAEEGEKLNIGGEGQRGGLLAQDSNGNNMLQILANSFPLENSTCVDAVDSKCLDALERLRESDLLKKEDIRRYDLLRYSCRKKAKQRFDYFVGWDPAALKECRYEGEPLLHHETRSGHSTAIENFVVALEAGLKHYPEELGFIFQKNSSGETAYELVFDRFGKDEAWRNIEKCFEETRNVKMVERNPMTSMYPFMLAAAPEETGDLNMLYYLLRRDPEVLYRVSDVDSLDSVVVEMTTRKRGHLNSA